jgi:hypothetical protein
LTIGAFAAPPVGWTEKKSTGILNFSLSAGH